MKTTRFIQPDEKLSLVYIIGRYIASNGPVHFDDIRNEVIDQYIGGERVMNSEINKVLSDLISEGIIEHYDSEYIFNVTAKTLGYINDPAIKYEKR